MTPLSSPLSRRLATHPAPAGRPALTDEDLLGRGAEARRYGRPLTSNPFRRAPRWRGDERPDLVERLRRADVWDLGWQLESTKGRGTTVALRAVAQRAAA